MNFQKTNLVLLLVLALLLLLPIGCKTAPPEQQAKPLLLTRAAVSADDGMILLDHPGPKGQLLRRDGATDYYCDTPGLLRAMADPERASKIATAFVQPFDDREWKSYADGWVEASRAVYVMGSRKMGGMGPTLVPFLDAGKAEIFVTANGGRILKYADINGETLRQVALLARSQLRGPAKPDGMTSHGMSTHGKMQGQKTIKPGDKK